MEEGVEIRLLHMSEGMTIKVIPCQLGVTRHTVRAAWLRRVL